MSADRLQLDFTRRRSTYERRAVISSTRLIHDVRPVSASAKHKAAHRQVFARTQLKSTPHRQQRSEVLARQFVAAKKPRARFLFNAKGLVLTASALVLFVFGVGVGIVQLNTNKDVKDQVKTLAAQVEQASTTDDGTLPDNGLPSESRGGGGYRWAPTADEPKRIKIPSLKVDARVLKLGVKPNGEIKTPNNIFDTGWLETTAKPGQHGAMFIDGHVHGPTQPGVFYDIKKMNPGDKIQVERGDGQVFTYSVVKTEKYAKEGVDMVAALNTAVPGKPGLNLITCEGRYNAENGYDHRVVVFAVMD